MQFVDAGVYLTVSEANTDGKVTITMDDGENLNYGQFIQLEIDDLIRLRNWLNESIETLKE